MIKRSYFYHARVYRGNSSSWNSTAGVITTKSWFADANAVFDDAVRATSEHHGVPTNKVEVITLSRV